MRRGYARAATLDNERRLPPPIESCHECWRTLMQKLSVPQVVVVARIKHVLALIIAYAVVALAYFIAAIVAMT